MIYKAISLWQPWASAMALGLKRNETRGWPLLYRGDLVICAAKRKLTELEREILYEVIHPHAPPCFELAYGCALCIVSVYGCRRTDGMILSGTENLLGNYATGRFAWLTRNLRRFKTPVPVTGRQGFFEITLDPLPEFDMVLP